MSSGRQCARHLCVTGLSITPLSRGLVVSGIQMGSELLMNKFSQLGEGGFQLRAPGMGAVEAQAVVVLPLTGEERTGRQREAAGERSGMQCSAVETGVNSSQRK